MNAILHLPAARRLAALSVVGAAALLGSIARADTPETPAMPAATPKVSTKDVPKPPIDLATPKAVSTATFALG